MSGLFITGTDTGIGKTVATASLLAWLRGRGLDAVAMKPVQTGCRRIPSGRRVPDLDFIRAATGWSPAAEEGVLACPYAFEPPCSPHLAAILSGQPISIPRLLYRYQRFAARHPVVLVEGAGGVCAPLSPEQTMLDLMLALRLPVVLVTHPRLGTLNHTLLSLHELRRAGLSVAGLVVVTADARPWGPIEQDNVEVLEKIGGARILARLPYLPALRQGPPTPAEFRAQTGTAWDAAAQALAYWLPRGAAEEIS